MCLMTRHKVCLYAYIRIMKGAMQMERTDEVKDIFSKLDTGNQEYILGILHALKHSQDLFTDSKGNNGVSNARRREANKDGGDLDT
jgi:hypothetical protein